MQLQDWTAAAGVLEAFRASCPEHELQREATRQIAFAYRQNGQLARAAGEYERVASESDDPALQGEALLVAGDLYEQSGSSAQALAAYTRYVEQFPRPVETAIETRFKIAEIPPGGARRAALPRRSWDRSCASMRKPAASGPAARGRSRRARRWSSPSSSTASSRASKLRQPFEASLEEKKQRMDAAMAAFDQLVDYEIGEVTAAATYYMAETHIGFSRSLLASERPASLQDAELEEYELALEEEAFPFEEQAIAVHEKNIELLRSGVYNAWTDKSLSRLAELVPVRYAKEELSSGYLGSIERYAYISPVAPQTVPAVQPVAALPPENREVSLAVAR